MLYNIKNKKIRTNVDCVSCQCFDTFNKKCVGFGKICFEYDKKTNKIVDPITKKTITIKEN
jgi:hypothetical protein